MTSPRVLFCFKGEEKSYGNLRQCVTLQGANDDRAGEKFACFSCTEVNLAHDFEAFGFDILDDHTEGIMLLFITWWQRMHEPLSRYIFSMSIVLSMKCFKKTKKEEWC